MLDSNWHNCAWIGIRFSAFHGAERLACVFPCECGPGGTAERWSEWTLKKRQRDIERGDLDRKWVLGLSTGPEVMEMRVCRYGTPRAPRLRYRSGYYPACTCQGIDNRPGFYQTATAAPISLLDVWLLIKFQCKSNHKKLPFLTFFFSFTDSIWFLFTDSKANDERRTYHSKKNTDNENKRDLHSKQCVCVSFLCAAIVSSRHLFLPVFLVPCSFYTQKSTTQIRCYGIQQTERERERKKEKNTSAHSYKQLLDMWGGVC